jgi:hypothetical protein
LACVDHIKILPNDSLSLSTPTGITTSTINAFVLHRRLSRADGPSRPGLYLFFCFFIIILYCIQSILHRISPVSSSLKKNNKGGSMRNRKWWRNPYIVLYGRHCFCMLVRPSVKEPLDSASAQ